jgi:PIN domain nuclease of toxin-antitoxin system
MRMNYLLDTHTWIWMHAVPEELSPTAVRIIEGCGPEDELLLSAISIWEVCKLVEKGRIALFEDLESWVGAALDVPGLRIVPLDFKVFYRSTTLPQPFHSDPADQMIVATARLRDATIITKDKLLQDYPHVKSVW